ncbi:CCC2 [Malassezia furfur]|nr:CCC2 [Malassezia furfur]
MLGQQKGIESVNVALLAERAVVEYDAGAGWTPEKIAEEIDDIGFEAEVVEEKSTEHVTLSVYGMTCASCTSSVEQVLAGVPGVLSASVSLALQQAVVHYDKRVTNVRALVQAIEDAGFDALLADSRDTSQISSLTRIQEVLEWKRAFLFSLAFSVPVFLLSMVLPQIRACHSVLDWQAVRGLYLRDVLCLVLTLPVQFGVGRRFFVPAWKAFKHRSATMDTLVILGTSAAWAYSVLAMLVAMACRGEACVRPTTFFDTSTMLITFVSLGRYLENAAKGKTSESLTRLMRLAPNKATIYTEDGSTREVPAELLHPGDVVIGGTVNGSGTFDFVVTRAGKDTSLSQIVTLVQDAQVSKAPIQDYADKVAGIFVPCILALSAATFVGWFVVAHFLPAAWQPPLFHRHGVNKVLECFKLCISVIVVACPCALGLSTPTAMMVGTGVGAANGILIKGGDSLEAACHIAHVVFDKTGTLTRGALRVQAAYWLHTPGGAQQLDAPCGAHTQRDVLAMMTAAEEKSEHLLARALHGAGIRAGVGGAAVLVGNAELHGGQAALLASAEGGPLLHFAGEHEENGCTVVYVSVDGALVAAFALADTLKPEARQTVQLLHDLGITCSIMTGDTAGTAHAVAEMVGVPADRVFAELSPNGKMVLLERERRALRDVPAAPRSRWARALARLGWAPGAARTGLAMVGDGVNDSPALATADVGMALCSGSDIAIAAASIVLMRDDLLDVPISLLLCRRIFAQIQLNFVWASMYNLVMVPLAMGCLLPWGIYMHPMMAGAAMACSSISVVLSSLSLKWWTRPEATVRAAPPTLLHAARDTLRSALRALATRTQRPDRGAYTALEMA